MCVKLYCTILFEYCEKLMREAFSQWLLKLYELMIRIGNVKRNKEIPDYFLIMSSNKNAYHAIL